MKKKELSKIAGVAFHASDDALLKKFPDLSEFARAAVFEGSEEVRVAPTFTFWAAGGQWKVAVKDRAEGLVLWLSGDCLGDLLVLLDSMVLSTDAPWRHDEASHERNGKRVRKSS